MPVLAPGLGWVDLKFRGSPSVIATAVVHDAGGVALIDPGPASCLESLELGLNGLGLRLAEVTHILLTHVHLDHAGATGTLVRRYPSLKVFDQMYIMTAGGPNFSTRSVLEYIYDEGFTNFRVGYASALSMLFFLVVLAVSAVWFMIVRSQESVV